jgi:hypothetical protein
MNDVSLKDFAPLPSIGLPRGLLNSAKKSDRVLRRE